MTLSALQKITFPHSRNQGEGMNKQREEEFKSSTNVYSKRILIKLISVENGVLHELLVNLPSKYCSMLSIHK